MGKFDYQLLILFDFSTFCRLRLQPFVNFDFNLLSILTSQPHRLRLQSSTSQPTRLRVRLLSLLGYEFHFSASSTTSSTSQPPRLQVRLLSLLDYEFRFRTSNLEATLVATLRRFLGQAHLVPLAEISNTRVTISNFVML